MYQINITDKISCLQHISCLQGTKSWLFLLQCKRAGLILESVLVFLYPFNVELSMTQKFSSKLYGSNTLDTKRQYVWLSCWLLKNALQHEKGHNTVHLTHCNTWPFSDTRVKYERVTFCSLLLYISTNLLSFVYVTNSCISKLLKNFTNVLVTSITLSYTNDTKCPLCSTKSSDIVLPNTH